MAGRWILVLVACLALTEHGLCAKIIHTDKIKEKNLPDEVFQHDTWEDEKSKRALDSAGDVAAGLGLSYFSLGVDLKASPTASSQLDMVFVMDNSGSIGSYHFGLQKTFVASLIEYFPIFPAKTRVAVVTYSDSIKLEFNFNKFINKECLRKGIGAIKYTGGLTATGTALEYVRNSLIHSAAAGARSGAKKVVFLLTDGQSNQGIGPGIPAGRLKTSGVIMFALGVTNNVRQSELEAIATSSSHVFHVADYATLEKVNKKIQAERSVRCSNRQPVYDKCGRRCTCKNGKLQDCCRLRKEFTAMSGSERVRYINTVKTASTDAAYKPAYDALLAVHKTIFRTSIHQRDFFLPWHRWFILQYENLLRQIDCRVTVPYWDWSLVGGNPFASSLWSTGANGFGENGVGGGSCVNTGPFRRGAWSLPGGACLQRKFSGRAPDAIAVSMLISSTSSSSDFFNFERLLRVQFHNVVHCIIDGTMCTRDSASAPEFFLHHGFIDKIWWDWQKQSNAHKFNTYFLGQAGLMTSTTYSSKDFLDLNNQPDCVCAEYVDSSNSSGAGINLKDLSITQLGGIPRLSLPPLSSKAKALFRTPDSDIAAVLRLRARIEPKHFVSKSSLHGKDALLGFEMDKYKKISVGVKRKRRLEAKETNVNE